MRQAGHVDRDELDEELERLELSLDGQARLDALRARADSFSPGEFGRAEFLTSLAEFLEMAGQLDEADAVYEEALVDGGDTTFHPLAGKLSVLVKRQGNGDVAQLTTRLWSLARSGQLVEADYEHIGETLEGVGRLREALRWYTVPLADYDPEEDIDLIPPVCSNGRFRVRRALGLPRDRYDDAAELVRQHASARWEEREPQE